MQQKRAILAIDGLQPDVGHEVLWVVREVLSGEVLCARSLLSSAKSELQSLSSAVVSALPGIPHQLCQFHYLREAAKPMWEADRHVKKELKKLVRGARPVERVAGPDDSVADDVIKGYCAAVRSALTDDARPPLVFGGLRLHERLTDIHASLQRSGE